MMWEVESQLHQDHHHSLVPPQRQQIQQHQHHHLHQIHRLEMHYHQREPNQMVELLLLFLGMVIQLLFHLVVLYILRHHQILMYLMVQVIVRALHPRHQQKK